MLDKEKLVDDFNKLLDTDGVNQRQVIYWLARIHDSTETEVAAALYGSSHVKSSEIELYDL